MGTVPAGRDKRDGAAEGPQTFRSPTAAVVWWVWLVFAAANLVDLAVQGRDHVSLVAAAILLLATGVAYVLAQRPRIIADDAGLTIRNPLRDHRVGWASVTKVDLADLLRVHCQLSPDDQRTKVISCWAVHYSRRRKFVAENRARRAAARAGSRRSLLSMPYGTGRGYGYGTAPASPDASAEAEAEKIVRLLSERATAARAEAVWAGGTVPIAGPGPGSEAGQAALATPAGPGPGPRPEAGHAAAAPAATGTGTVGDTGMDLHGTGWLEPLKSTWNGVAIAALLIPALILLLVSLL